MNVYLIRHGHAEALHASGGGDFDRALTPLGVSVLRRAGAEMDRRGIRPSTIFSSPYRRARETAEILAEILQPLNGVEVVEALGSGASPETLVEWALEDDGTGDRMVVGHNPEIEMAVRQLARTARPAPGPMRPGTLAWFRLTPGDPAALPGLMGQWDGESLAEAAGPTV